MTMATVVRETADECFCNAWDRARAASRLRHLALQEGNVRAARVFGRMKANAIRCAAEILPERVRITPHRVGEHDLALITVGRSGLHLPFEVAPRGMSCSR